VNIMFLLEFSTMQSLLANENPRSFQTQKFFNKSIKLFDKEASENFSAIFELVEDQFFSLGRLDSFPSGAEFDQNPVTRYSCLLVQFDQVQRFLDLSVNVERQTTT
jgi:hypothetical protein